MSYFIEKPNLKLKIEIEVPDEPGGPCRKFAVSRTLKAKWDDNPEKVTKEILNEVKNYKGSFIGDIVFSLNHLVKSSGGPIYSESTRLNDVVKWTVNIIDILLLSSVREKLHKELLEDFQIIEWDGYSRDIEKVSYEEFKNVDIEKVLLLLSPRIKQLISLMSKDMK